MTENKSTDGFDKEPKQSGTDDLGDLKDASLLKVIERCGKYTKSESDVSYVFDVKFIKDSWWMFVMKKNEKTIIVSCDDVVDELNATYKAHDLEFIEMFKINILDKSAINYDEIKDYIDQVNGTKIKRFFKTPLRAYYARHFPSNQKFTGKWFYWNLNGGKYEECQYVSGVSIGTSTIWYANGKRESKTKFIPNSNKVYFTNYYRDTPSEVKESEGIKVDGEREGPWIEYNEKGEKSSTGEYLRGFRKGLWINYDSDGQKTHEKEYE